MLVLEIIIVHVYFFEENNKTHTRTHARMHTHIHTHIHTYTHV